MNLSCPWFDLIRQILTSEKDVWRISRLDDIIKNSYYLWWQYLFESHTHIVVGCFTAIWRCTVYVGTQWKEALLHYSSEKSNLFNTFHTVTVKKSPNTMCSVCSVTLNISMYICYRRMLHRMEKDIKSLFLFYFFAPSRSTFEWIFYMNYVCFMFVHIIKKISYFNVVHIIIIKSTSLIFL